MRPSGRTPDQMRTLSFEPGFTKHAEGACLVSFGETRVLCPASVEDKVPPFLRGKGQGWVTPEYGMLPPATHTRSQREASMGVSVKATNSEIAMATPMVNPKLRRKRPGMLFMKATGKNTASSDKVVASTARPISLVA